MGEFIRLMWETSAIYAIWCVLIDDHGDSLISDAGLKRLNELEHKAIYEQDELECGENEDIT